MHNSIVSVWSDCLSELKLHHKKEPRDRYSTSDSRPDIIVFDTGAGSNVELVELDVALAHPWSSDIFPTSATTDGAAASRREERKKARYDRERYPGGLSVKVTPLVLEHFGRWGKQGEEYLDQLSNDPQMTLEDQTELSLRTMVCHSAAKVQCWCLPEENFISQWTIINI